MLAPAFQLLLELAWPQRGPYFLLCTEDSYVMSQLTQHSPCWSWCSPMASISSSLEDSYVTSSACAMLAPVFPHYAASIPSSIEDLYEVTGPQSRTCLAIHTLLELV